MAKGTRTMFDKEKVEEHLAAIDTKYQKQLEKRVEILMEKDGMSTEDPRNAALDYAKEIKSLGEQIDHVKKLTQACMDRREDLAEDYLPGFNYLTEKLDDLKRDLRDNQAKLHATGYDMEDLLEEDVPASRDHADPQHEKTAKKSADNPAHDTATKKEAKSPSHFSELMTFQTTVWEEMIKAAALLRATLEQLKESLSGFAKNPKTRSAEDRVDGFALGAKEVFGSIIRASMLAHMEILKQSRAVLMRELHDLPKDPSPDVRAKETRPTQVAEAARTFLNVVFRRKDFGDAAKSSQEKIQGAYRARPDELMRAIVRLDQKIDDLEQRYDASLARSTNAVYHDMTSEQARSGRGAETAKEPNGIEKALNRAKGKGAPANAAPEDRTAGSDDLER